MSIMNWITQKSLISEAKRTAKWAKERYDEVKAEHPELDEKKIYIRMVFDVDKFNNLKEENKKYIETCCQTIEGLCYMMVMDGNLKGWMKFRLTQFTKYMDYYLYNMGFTKQTKRQKENILKALDIYLENWEDLIK